MAPARPFILSVLLLSLAFAGCAGKGGGANEKPAEPSSTVAVVEGDIADAGEITGIVIDDENLPLAGAVVGLRELNVEATTDASGAFHITNVPPGTYLLVAAKLGYDSHAVRVEVEPLAVVTRTLSLKPIAVDVDRHEVFGPYTGYLVCGFVRPGVQGAVGTVTYDCANTFSAASSVLGEWKNRFDFKMSQDNLDAVVGETQWTPSAAGTSPKLQTFFSYAGGSGSHWWCSAMGATPTRFVYTLDEEAPERACHDKGSSSAEPEPTKKLTLRMSVYLPFCRVNTATATDVPLCVTFQQRYNAMSTIFYGKPAPTDYSAFPDA